VASSAKWYTLCDFLDFRPGEKMENLLVGGLPQSPGKGRLLCLAKRSTGGAAMRLFGR